MQAQIKTGWISPTFLLCHDSVRFFFGKIIGILKIRKISSTLLSIRLNEKWRFYMNDKVLLLIKWKKNEVSSYDRRLKESGNLSR